MFRQSCEGNVIPMLTELCERAPVRVLVSRLLVSAQNRAVVIIAPPKPAPTPPQQHGNCLCSQDGQCRARGLGEGVLYKQIPGAPSVYWAGLSRSFLLKVPEAHPGPVRGERLHTALPAPRPDQRQQALLQLAPGCLPGV